MFDKKNLPLDLNKVSGNRENLELAFDLLVLQGWATRQQNQVKLTPKGILAVERVTSYGVPVSYLATYQMVPQLLFWDPASIPRRGKDGRELLVDRPMNVRGSGGAHKNYFAKIDEIILEILNLPLDQQPDGFCDTGCGNGFLLKHLWELAHLKDQDGRYVTLRGQHLQEKPVKLVGVDFNEEALQATRDTFIKAGIPAEDYCLLVGNITGPHEIAVQMKKKGLEMNQFLHVRSFLDHNRPYEPGAPYQPANAYYESTGAYAALGAEVFIDELQINLIQHLRQWAPYVKKFGLVDLELHTLDPALVSQNLDKTPAVAYDASHGYSDQYLVELDVWLQCAREAGLLQDPRYSVVKFPPNDLATISITYLRDLAVAAAFSQLETDAAVASAI